MAQNTKFELLKFAAIDIGTNAVRLLLTNIIEDGDKTTFKKSSLVRSPVRLGADVFQFGSISLPLMQTLIDTMHAYKYLMLVNKVVNYRACATSAMREAANGAHVIEQVRLQTGIEIDLISGDEEAEILYSAHLSRLLKSEKTYLYIDVGGGSTEVTVFDKKRPVMSHSFNIGTIRILKDKVPEGERDQMKEWFKNINGQFSDIQMIGSGGNVNRLFKLAEKKEGKPLHLDELQKIYRHLTEHSYEDRIRLLGLNPDRADVIIPAAKLFIDMMEWAGINSIFVPKIGLSDGVVRKLYQDYKGR